MDFSRLSVHSRKQVKLFLNFFKDKRKSQNLYAHEEFIAMHEKSALMGDLLGQDDVNDLLDETEVQVMVSFGRPEDTCVMANLQTH